MRWLPGSLATSVRQGVGGARLDRNNPINRASAFAWAAQSPLLEMVGGLTASTNNTTRQPVASGVAARCSAGQTNVEFLAQPLVTSDGAGTGDYTMLVFSNPTSKSANEHMLAQKNDGGGSPFSQTAILANQTELGVTTPGVICFFSFNGSDSGVSATSALTGNFHVWIGRRQGTEHSIWKDGVRLNAATRTVRAIIQAGNARRLAIGSRGNGTTEAFAGDALYAHGWNRALTDAEIVKIGPTPWQLLAPLDRPIWAPSTAAATVFRLISDTTANGWTAVGAASVSAATNEVTPSDAEYGLSPDLTSSFTGSIGSMPAGTYTVAFRADRTLTQGQVRIRYLDAGNADVGGTAWQALTTTASSYSLSATTSATATQARIEVQP